MIESLKEQVIKYKAEKKGKYWISHKLRITVEDVEIILGKRKKEESEENIQKINNEKGTLESTVVSSFEPKNHEELAKLHKVDLLKYKISSYWTKQKGDKFTSSLLCSLIKAEDFSIEKFQEFLSTYKPPQLSTVCWNSNTPKEVADMEISLADFHLDKLTVEEETPEQRKEQYKKILQGLVRKATSIYDIDTLVFVLSNDFFHTDNIHNQTTSGTQMQTSMTWNKAYEEGFDLMVWAINYLRGYCNTLEVVLVQGNHDRTKSFYMAHALEVFFKNCKNVYFDRNANNIKYTVLGNTFIGYHHGNCKLGDLPMVFATDKDSSKEFGNATYREIHTGDKHFYLAKEDKGVRIQQMPSLSGTDQWHKDNNFVNSIRAGLALIYHPINGKCCEFEERN